MNPNDLTGAVVDAAIKVHRALGPGLLESAYQACLAFELRDRDLLVETEVPLPVVYRDVQLEVGYRIDLLVENQVIVELKSVDSLLPIHQAQVLSYMKMSNKKVGLLINFNVTLLKDGERRLVKNF